MQKTPVPKKSAKNCTQIIKKTPIPKKSNNFTEPILGSSSLTLQLNKSTTLPEYASTPALVRNIDRKTPEGSLENCIPNSYTNHTITSVNTTSDNTSNKINNININSYRAIPASTTTEEKVQQSKGDRIAALMTEALEEVEKSPSNQEDQLVFDTEFGLIKRKSKLALVETDELGLVEMDLSGYEITEEQDPEAFRKAKIAARMAEKRAELADLPPEPDPDPNFQRALDEIAAFQYVPSDPNTPPPKSKIIVETNSFSKLKPKIMIPEMMEKFLQEVREERRKAKAKRAEQKREWLEFECGKLPN